MVTRRMFLKTVKGDDDYGDDYMQWRCRMMWMSLVVLVVDRYSVCCYVINLLILDFLVVVRHVSSSFHYRRNGNGNGNGKL